MDDSLVDDFRRWVKDRTGDDYAPRVLRKALAAASGENVEEPNSKLSKGVRPMVEALWPGIKRKLEDRGNDPIRMGELPGGKDAIWEFVDDGRLVESGGWVSLPGGLARKAYTADGTYYDEDDVNEWHIDYILSGQKRETLIVRVNDPEEAFRQARQQLSKHPGYSIQGGPYLSRKSLVAKEIDRELMRQIDALMENLPDDLPAEAGTVGDADLPALLGHIQGDAVYVVDGDEIKTREDEPEDAEHPHMDFTEGSNDLAHPWCRREFGPNTVVLDGNLARHDLPRVAYHELIERGIMAAGEKYEDAHDEALAGEREVRQEPAKGLVNRLRPYANGVK